MEVRGGRCSPRQTSRPGARWQDGQGWRGPGAARLWKSRPAETAPPPHAVVQPPGTGRQPVCSPHRSERQHAITASGWPVYLERRVCARRLQSSVARRQDVLAGDTPLGSEGRLVAGACDDRLPSLGTAGLEGCDLRRRMRFCSTAASLGHRLVRLGRRSDDGRSAKTANREVVTNLLHPLDRVLDRIEALRRSVRRTRRSAIKTMVVQGSPYSRRRRESFFRLSLVVGWGFSDRSAGQT
jgi:hypothetical protein